MDKLLDKEVHQLYKASPHDCDISNYFGTNSASLKNATETETDGLAVASLSLVDGDEGFIADSSDTCKMSSSRERDTSEVYSACSTNHQSKTLVLLFITYSVVQSIQCWLSGS